jgi:hypothetical protein
MEFTRPLSNKEEIAKILRNQNMDEGFIADLMKLVEQYALSQRYKGASINGSIVEMSGTAMCPVEEDDVGSHVIPTTRSVVGNSVEPWYHYIIS